jgi:hypothetical protein
MVLAHGFKNLLTNTVTVPVMDMRFCVSHLEVIRLEAGDFALKDFSDYWAPDNKKTTPNRPNTFVPNRLARGDYPLWAPFYDSGQTKLGLMDHQKLTPIIPLSSVSQLSCSGE